MAFQRIVYVVILALACVHALPIFLQEPSLSGMESEEQFPSTYLVLLRDSLDGSNLNDKEIEDPVTRGKRRTEDFPLDDLETAAGTNVLRPLFVYRQQVAYRQRVRNNRLRRYRF